MDRLGCELCRVGTRISSVRSSLRGEFKGVPKSSAIKIDSTLIFFNHQNP